MKNLLPQSVRIVEVGPRDGLQNEAQPISVEVKVKLVELLAEAGLGCIETGSFVNPKWVPQMAGSEKVFSSLRRVAGVTYSALTPNLKGFERALESAVSEVAVFTAASESFTRKNTNCSIDESLSRASELMTAARANNVPVRGYVSCVVGCPYEGDIAPAKVAEVASKLLDMGCY